MLLVLGLCPVTHAASVYDGLTIAGEGLPGISLWHPWDPAGAMEEVTQNVYVKKLYCPAGTSMSFKLVGLSNDADVEWFGCSEVVLGQPAVLDRGGDSQIIRLVARQDCILTITADLTALSNGGNATVLIDGGPNMLNPAEFPHILYVKAPAGTASLYAFTWDNENNNSLGQWPGTPMYQSGEWFYIGIPADLSFLRFSSKAGYTSPVITVDSGSDVWIDLSQGDTLISYDGVPLTQSEDLPFSLYVSAPEWMATLNAYTWDDTGFQRFGLWPGSPMIRRNDWFHISIPADMTNLVLNCANGFQTDDLKLEPGQDVWITLEGDMTASISYDQPGSEPTEPTKPSAPGESQGEPSEYRVVGNADIFGNWDPANDKGVLLEVEPGVYKKTFEDVPPGDYEICVTKDGSWEQSWRAEDGNYRFTVIEQTNIFVTFRLEGEEGVITVTAPGIPCTGGDPEVTEPPETLPAEPVPTDPLPTEPVTTDPPPTQLPTEPVITQPTENPWIEIPPDLGDPTPDDTQPEEEDPTEPPVTAPTDTNTPSEPDSDTPVSPLVNLPIYSLNLFFIGMIALCLYLILTVIRLKRTLIAVTKSGAVVQMNTSLTDEEVENLVKNSAPQPSEKLDDAILTAIERIDQEHP